MNTLTYHNGRAVEIADPDPQTFTPEQRAAHARIYAETGSRIAGWLAGVKAKPE